MTITPAMASPTPRSQSIALLQKPKTHSTWQPIVGYVTSSFDTYSIAS